MLETLSLNAGLINSVNDVKECARKNSVDKTDDFFVGDLKIETDKSQNNFTVCLTVCT